MIRAVVPIAERRVYTVLPFGPNAEIEAINEKARLFFVGKCANTLFLKNNNISVVFSPVACENKELTNPVGKVWVLG